MIKQILNLKLKTFKTSQDNERDLIQHFHPPFNDRDNKGKICPEVKRKHIQNLHINKKYYKNKNDFK